MAVDRVKKWGLIAIAATAAGMGAYLSGVGGGADSQAFIPVDKAHAIDADSWVVCGSSGHDSDVRRASRLAVIEQDGSTSAAVYLDEELEVWGVTEDEIWLHSPSMVLHARTLPDLELIEPVGASVAENPSFELAVTPVGFTDDSYVVAAAGKEFEIGLDGTIEPIAQRPEPLTSARHRSLGSERIFSEARIREISAALSRVPALSRPSMIFDAYAGGPVTFGEPPEGVLVVTFDPAPKRRLTQSVHRTGLDGEVIWSATSANLLDALELEGQGTLVRWAGWRGDELWAMVQLSEYENWNDGESSGETEHHTVRLVRIDPETGEIVEHRDVKPPAEA